jgi:transcriptional regulator with XRE-family HTH domain
MGDRGPRHIRKFIGQRLRALRKHKNLSQERLGELAGLSGKFIGEVERGEKSISIDSLYSIAVALDVPLGQLTDVPLGKRVAPSEEAEKIFALMSGPYPPEEIRRAYNILRALFGKVS